MGRDRRVILGGIGATFACLACLTPALGLGLGTMGIGTVTGRLDRVGLHHPVGHVVLVDVLLDDVIAREVVEVVPVADLPLHVAHAFLARVLPQVSGVEQDPAAEQFAVLRAQLRGLVDSTIALLRRRQV